MATPRRQLAALFADKASQRWIVRDPEGNFWVLPAMTDPWSQREPFELTPETDLEPVPGHYKHTLGLPF